MQTDYIIREFLSDSFHTVPGVLNNLKVCTVCSETCFSTLTAATTFSTTFICSDNTNALGADQRMRSMLVLAAAHVSVALEKTLHKSGKGKVSSSAPTKMPDVSRR